MSFWGLDRANFTSISIFKQTRRGTYVNEHINEQWLIDVTKILDLTLKWSEIFTRSRKVYTLSINTICVSKIQGSATEKFASSLLLELWRSFTPHIYSLNRLRQNVKFVCMCLIRNSWQRYKLLPISPLISCSQYWLLKNYKINLQCGSKTYTTVQKLK